MIELFIRKSRILEREVFKVRISKEIVNQDFNDEIVFDHNDSEWIELNQRYISGSVHMAMGRVMTLDDFKDLRYRMSEIKLPWMETSMNALNHPSMPRDIHDFIDEESLLLHSLCKERMSVVDSVMVKIICKIA